MTGDENTDKALNAETARRQLASAFAQNDYATFLNVYLKFLHRFPEFSESFTEQKAGMDVQNPMFGGHAFYLRRTSNKETDALHQNVREASRMLAGLPVADRIAFLNVLHGKIMDHEQDIILTISADTGKPYDLAAGEMKKGNEWFNFAREQAVAQLGANEAKPVGQGVAQVIGAFNYPYALSIGGIVGALAAGCGVILSAPGKAPNWVFPFKAAVQEAILAFAQEALATAKPWAWDFAREMDKLIQVTIGVNRGITKIADIVHFVGGDEVGKKIAKVRTGKRTVLELGGSSVAVVMASAIAGSDEKAARIADILYQGFAFATGQRCTAPRVLCVQTGAERVIAALKKRCAGGAARGDGGIGNPFETGVKIGPLVDREAYAQMEKALELAARLRANVTGKLNSDALPQSGRTGAHWVNPVIIDWSRAELMDPKDVKALRALMSTEIFGPLLHIVKPALSLDEAIMTTHMIDVHGLAGAIFTGDPEDTRRYREQVHVTHVMENAAPKDQSPAGPHGHPGKLVIGGSGHFLLYAESSAIGTRSPLESRHSTI